jgi:GNAT superfamily N-acetyltransferase
METNLILSTTFKEHPMFIIRSYHNQDSIEVGQLIAETYTKYNLTSIPRSELPLFLGPFTYAYSQDKNHQHDIADAINAEFVLVAAADDKIIGVLRGRPGKLQSLFVAENYHGQGIGRQLVLTFENECKKYGSNVIKVQATLYAVPFYQSVGYQRTTGIRRMNSFDGEGLPYQPMKKILLSE